MGNFKYAFKKSLPVLCGYLAVGIAFGLLFTAEGLPFWLALLSSFIIYAGSAQILLVSLITAGSGLWEIAMLIFLLNFRHFFYGLSMVSRYKDTGARKPYLIFSLTDETYALLSTDGKDYGDRGKYYFTISLLHQCYWIMGTLIGSTIGKLITFNTEGLDFAMTALFIVLLIEQLKGGKKKVIPALIGGGCAIISLVIFGAEGFLLPALIVIVAIMLIRRVKYEG